MLIYYKYNIPLILKFQFETGCTEHSVIFAIFVDVWIVDLRQVHSLVKKIKKTFLLRTYMTI